MRAYDFEYDGLKLSDFGYMICSFGSKGLQTVSAGSHITFNTIGFMYGEKHILTNSEYKECLNTEIQICKKNCSSNDYVITANEIRLLSKWLNRKHFHKLKILSDEYMNLYFEANCNINTLEMDGKVYGLEISIETNRPYALQEPEVKIITSTSEDVELDTEFRINNYSDAEGFIYPKTEILISESGDLKINNKTENRETLIKNCSKGEYIIMDYPIIETSDINHKIQNDFNWSFFRLANTFRNSVNLLSISLPCVFKITYSPYVKLGL